MIKNSLKKIIHYPNYRLIKKIDLLRNKDVFILGSAPNPDLSSYSKKKILVTFLVRDKLGNRLKTRQ